MREREGERDRPSEKEGGGGREIQRQTERERERIHCARSPGSEAHQSLYIVSSPEEAITVPTPLFAKSFKTTLVISPRTPT